VKRSQLEAWINVRRFISGRRSFCAYTIRPKAQAFGLDAVGGLCDAIIAAEQQQQVLQSRWQTVNGVPVVWSPELVALDVTLDRNVAELRDLLHALSAGGSDRAKAAKRLYAKHFDKQGVAYYTQAIYEEEAERVGALVSQLAAEGDAADVTGATVEEHFATLRDTHVAYAALVRNPERPPRMAYDELKTTDLVNQRRFLALVVKILDLTEGTADGLAQRKELLAIVEEQDAEVFAELRAKRKVRDVDPVSGQPLEDADGQPQS